MKIKCRVGSVNQLTSKPLNMDDESLPRVVWIVRLTTFPHHADIELSNDALVDEDNDRFVEWVKTLKCHDKLEIDLSKIGG